MDEDKQAQVRIVEAAKERFLKLGFNAVTMDELAFDLGMSKKTLYKHFPTKTDLLKAVMDDRRTELEQGIQKFLRDESLPLGEKLQQTMAYLAEKTGEVCQGFFLEVSRTAPEVFRSIEEWRREKVENEFRALVAEGVRTHVFRADLDQNLMVITFLQMIDMLRPEVMGESDLSPRRVFEEIHRVAFRGILTEEARKKFFSQEVVLPEFKDTQFTLTNGANGTA